ncbi:complex I subunit 4 family protein [Miltoncostaea marina]|uniref:complex I subunit 4 family protein n=1 Tax=Miltoncostaea marina TaxID=2843215 RepID=UPI001C3E2585|nr:NADH-quinone oxidoreductase subunit M [Miltoncostaea marina]
MPWVSAIVLLPLVGALSLLAVPPGGAGAVQARIHALVAALGTLVLTVVLVVEFDQDVAGLQHIDHAGWAEQVGLSWDVGVDGISLWLIVLTSALFALGVGAACWRLPERPRGFLALLLLAETGLLGLFAAGHLVLFYVFWEAMLVPFFFLIAMWGGEGRRRATATFVIYTMVGSLLMLVAIIATAFVARDATGQFTFLIRDLEGVAFTDTQSTWLFLGFALAFAIKLPLWPFHAWLPRTYVAAPILVTALLGAVMSKAGVYGFIRVGLPVFPEGAHRLAVPLGALAVAGIVYGSLLAWRAPTMRLLVAYSSVAHLGFIALGIVAIDVQASQGAVLQMINHGVVVAALFGVVAVINRVAPDDRMDGLGGLAAGAPRLAGVFLIVAMASLAIPGSNSFAGEFLILTGVFRQHVWLAALACLGIAYAAVYMLRMYQTTMNGPVPGGADDGRRAELRGRDLAILLPLVAAMLVIALWPRGIVDATTRSIERAVAPAQVAAGRPADQIRATPAQNPPAEALPLPGDEAEVTP